MADTLKVFWNARPVGDLWLDDKRELAFQYHDSWLSDPHASPLSLRLPLRPEAYASETTRLFFVNLLPEANVRAHVARRLGVSEKNDFKLLEMLGGDCAGAISLLAEGRSPTADGGYDPLSYDELDELIAEMERRPLLTARDGLRLSLAGAQEKLPVYLKDGTFYLPRGANPSSHILKPEIARFEATVENEAFVMTLAGACGLPAPKVTIHDGRFRVLVVERYDRATGAKDLPTRVHQEDFCQALGYSYEQKHETEGGPALKQCFSILDAHSAEPITDKRILIRWTVFNCLVGNCDAHAKNISVLFSGGSVRLAPFYDLLSTRAYPQLSEKLAMRVGGQFRPESLRRSHWERLSDDAGVAPRAVFSIVDDLCETLPERARRLSERYIADFGSERPACAKTLERIVKLIATTSRTTQERMKRA